MSSALSYQLLSSTNIPGFSSTNIPICIVIGIVFICTICTIIIRGAISDLHHWYIPICTIIIRGAIIRGITVIHIIMGISIMIVIVNIINNIINIIVRIRTIIIPICIVINIITIIIPTISRNHRENLIQESDHSRRSHVS